MKKILLLLSFLSISSIINAQEDQEFDNTKQELKLNLAMSVAGVPEITYEYFLEDNSSIGASVAISLESEEDMALRFIFSPYYRLFFGKKKNAGFFIEANTAVATYYDYYSEYYYDDNLMEERHIFYDEKTTNFGLGAAVGFKLLTRNNYIGEIYAGAGRLFGDQKAAEAYPRVGITIGKRF